MESEHRTLDTLEWVAGHPALDFVNTVHTWHDGRPGDDYLHQFSDLADWLRAAGLIEHEQALALNRSPASAGREVLATARKLRRTLHTLFTAVADGHGLPDAAVKRLDSLVIETAAWRHLVPVGTRLAPGWTITQRSPQAALGPLAWSAAELLIAGPLERIKQCPPPDGCGWLFLDTSRNRSRTWCSMQTCGNAAKVKRFRKRQREG